MTSLDKKSFEFNPEVEYKLFPEGEAVVTFKDFEEIEPVEIRGRMVKRLHTIFEFDEDRDIHHNMLMIGGKKYLPYQLIYAIKGEYTPGDIGELLGNRVVVNVVHNTAKDGTVYANIDAIYPFDEDEYEGYYNEQDFEEMDF